MAPRLRLAVVAGLALAATACASTGAVPRPFPVPGGVSPPASAAGSARGEAIVETAVALRGVPYRDGGADPRGFDCSGFVQYVFAQHAVALPRSVAEQARIGSAISAKAVRPGDLLFFGTERARPSHVGIALGGDAFIHAPSSRGEVRVERVSTPYWSRRLLEARRVS